jgi:hypothetical protein
MDPPGIGGQLAPPRLIQVLDAPHEMQAFRQHHQDDAHVLGDTEQQAAQIFLVPVLLLGGNDRLDIGELADAAQVSHHAANAGSEALGQTHLGHVARFQAAVEEGGDQSVRILAHPRQDVGGGQAIADLGLPRLQGLAAPAAQQKGTGVAEAGTIPLAVLFRQRRKPVFDGRRIVRGVLGEVINRCYHGISLGHGGGVGLTGPYPSKRRARLIPIA